MVTRLLKNVFGAAALACFTAGLSGLTVMPITPWVVAGLFIAGGISGLLTLTLHLKEHRDNSKALTTLGNFLTKGRDVSNGLDPHKSDADIKAEIDAWVTAAHTFIKKNLGDAEAALFLDNSGDSIGQYTGWYARSHWVNYVLGRQERLRELIQRKAVRD